MRRRDVLRRGSIGLAGALALAGCSGDGGGNGTATGFDQEDAGAVAENAIEGLTIVGWTSGVPNEVFSVDVVVQNTGSESTDASDYTYHIQPYDSAGDEIEVTGVSRTYPEGSTQLSGGDTTTVRVAPSIDAEPDAVEEYDITLDCEGPFAEGTYCP